MNRLIIRLQEEMIVEKIIDNTIIIKIPDECSRDLWRGQVVIRLLDDLDKQEDMRYLSVVNNSSHTKTKLSVYR